MQRDHLFISYATEDVALADWLARRLAASGFAIWYDRLRLLGGEPWPRDIDAAIKGRTFRMLALLSRVSLAKDNPSRERTTAQALGKSIGVADFLIPLKVEAFPATELPWTLAETHYIDFAKGWAEGLEALLRKLASLDAPRALVDGRRWAIESLKHDECVVEREERLWSNVLPILRVPETLYRYRTSKHLTADQIKELGRAWPCYALASNAFVSFMRPDRETQLSYHVSSGDLVAWQGSDLFDGVLTRNLIASLLRSTFDRLFAARGLQRSGKDEWYVPDGLLPNNWLRYRRPDGIAGRVLAVGVRTYYAGAKSARYRYHLSPSFVVRGSPGRFFLVLRNRVYLTTDAGVPLEGRQIVSRRKHLCKAWWNDDWLSRQRGVLGLLAGTEASLAVGESATRVEASHTPLSFTVPLSIEEDRAKAPPLEVDANGSDDGMGDDTFLEAAADE